MDRDNYAAANPKDATLKTTRIDTDFYSTHINEVITQWQNDHEDFFDQRVEWLESARDFSYQHNESAFESSACIHIPVIFMYKKALHAKLYQLFGQHLAFYSVESQHQAFEEKEELVKRFMNWVLTKWSNRGRGLKAVFDRFLDDVCEDGTGILKLYWDRWQHEYLKAEVETEMEDDVDLLGGIGIEVEKSTNIKAKISNKMVQEQQAAPRVGVVGIEEFMMPPGYEDIDDAPWIAHRVYMTDEDLKIRARDKKFEKDVVDEVMKMKTSIFSGEYDNYGALDAKRTLSEIEGIQSDLSSDDRQRWDNQNHQIIEFYCRGYVEKQIDDDTFESMTKFPQEIVMWYHWASRKVLGWTYLHRITPDGKRPFYKADLIPSKRRAFGIGTSEMIFQFNKYIDSFVNMRLDNGQLSSLQFGMYRASSTIKPDTFRVSPGEMIPVEDVNDVKFGSFPYLGNFGQQEEQNANGYIQQLLSLNEVDLGNLGQKGVAGALRNATGSNYVDRQSTIQLHPHFDRIATCLGRLLGGLFKLCRERMPESLVFRVTGEDGKPIFGNVKAEDIKGDYDFDIAIDILSTSEAENQQRASLMLQTLLNPTFMQTGIVTPENFYNLLKEFLIRHRVKRPDMFITKPQQYQGPKLTPMDRVFKIMMNMYDDPRIESTVRLDEDHKTALEFLQKFEDSDSFGYLQDARQVAAFQALKQAHQQMLSAQNAPGLLNNTGTQFSNQGGLPAMPTDGSIPNPADGQQGPLGAPQGEANGPVF